MIHPNDLDRAEQAVLKAYEAGEFRRVRAVRQEKERYRTLATWTLSKPRSINIRIAERDLRRLKTLAAEHGMPYQTFISALLHQHSKRRSLPSDPTAVK